MSEDYGRTSPTDATLSMTTFRITQAESPTDIATVRDLFTLYVEWLNIDLAFQSFEAELASLPGKYARPRGALLLARDVSTAKVLGCIAMRPLHLKPEFRLTAEDGHTVTKNDCQPRTCELKRLYTLPAARKRGVGRALVRAALELAEHGGYEVALLDTLASMIPAIALYCHEGFVPTLKYYDMPRDDAVFMRKRLYPKAT